MASRLPRLTVLMGIAAALGVSACSTGFASAELARAPDWFKERQKELAGKAYPKLSDAPPLAQVKREDAHWDKVERDLKAEQSAIDASPRAAPATPEATDAFDKAAREAIEAARPK